MEGSMKLQAVLLKDRDGNPTFAHGICDDDKDLWGFVVGDQNIQKRQDFPLSPRMVELLPVIRLILANEERFRLLVDAWNSTLFEWGRQYEREHPKKE